jgi:hypothetical protein
MKDSSRLTTADESVSDGIGQDTVGEEFDNPEASRTIIVRLSIPVLSRRGPLGWDRLGPLRPLQSFLHSRPLSQTLQPIPALS